MERDQGSYTLVTKRCSCVVLCIVTLMVRYVYSTPTEWNVQNFRVEMEEFIHKYLHASPKTQFIHWYIHASSKQN
jgi:hypothetical protein